MIRKQKNTRRPLILGLTGSIGMGKSTVANLLASFFGLPVHSADEAVHQALKPGGQAVKGIARLFPETKKRGGIDRRLLGQAVFQEPKKLLLLEKKLHPLVIASERQFIKKAQREGKKAVVLEIPLLFETKAQKRCDVTLCVSAPRTLQEKRVLRRRGMTKAKFYAILARQMPDKEKRRRADIVISTGKSVPDTKRQLKKMWAALQRKAW